MSDYTVQLEQVFQGPMDLLLHLVREQEVEIHEVEIAKVIDGYFEYLHDLEDLDLEIAGDFLVLAATLMSIKSRSLLPRDEVELEDELDPQDELIQRLIEYRRFKGAAQDLAGRFDDRSRIHARGYRREVVDNEPEKTLDLGELSAFDLLAVFSRLVRETLANRPHHVRGDPRPLRWYVKQVGHAIQRGQDMELRSLLATSLEQPTREGLIGVFCALLELMKLGVVAAHQERPEDDIRIHLTRDLADDLDDLIGATRFLDELEGGDDGLGAPPAGAGEVPLGSTTPDE